MHEPQAKSWMRYALYTAGAYNVVWGVFAIALPSQAFRFAGLPPPNYPELGQLAGMLVGLYGIGYAIAGTNPHRHWAIVLVGLLSKVLAPLGFWQAAAAGRLPWTLGYMIVIDDLIWWLPFAFILKSAYEAHLDALRETSPEIMRIALRARTQHGATIDALSRETPILLVFLRHTGCTFCREALSDLAAQRKAMEASGTRVVLVHMGSDECRTHEFLARYGLERLPRISDPARNLYRAFGLRRGALWDLFGPKVWWRGFQAGVLGGHGAGRLVGDGFQMPGVFLIYHGEILRTYRHQSAADRPNYVDLASGMRLSGAL